MGDVLKPVGKLVGGLLGMESPAPVAALEAPPTVAAEPKPTMPTPTPDDAAVKAARKRSISSQKKRMGRASTILTGDEPLGG